MFLSPRFLSCRTRFSALSTLPTARIVLSLLQLDDDRIYTRARAHSPPNEHIIISRSVYCLCIRSVVDRRPTAGVSILAVAYENPCRLSPTTSETSRPFVRSPVRLSGPFRPALNIEYGFTTRKPKIHGRS